MLRLSMRRGMSELLAIVIGILITIGVGVALFTAIPKLITTNIQSARVALDLYASMINNSAAVITVTLKNLGQIDINKIKVLSIEVNGNRITSAIIICPDGKEATLNSEIDIELPPGMQTSFVIYVKSPYIKMGAKITIVVKADSTVMHGITTVMP